MVAACSTSEGKARGDSILPHHTRHSEARKASRRKGADGSGLTTTQCLSQLKDAEDVDIVMKAEASWVVAI